jgi:hypothetical protein
MSMPTPQQIRGAFGEEQVVRNCSCPHRKPSRRLVRLPPNFRCADVVSDFHGFQGQVKTSESERLDQPPNSVPGATWEPQRERMTSGIYISLFLVLVTPGMASYAIYYFSGDLQRPEMFKPRKIPLSDNAQRHGRTGFDYDLKPVHAFFVRRVAFNARSREFAKLFSSGRGSTQCRKQLPSWAPLCSSSLRRWGWQASSPGGSRSGNFGQLFSALI